MIRETLLAASLAALLAAAPAAQARGSHHSSASKSSSSSSGRHNVRGYHRKDGTYVAPHTAANPTKHKGGAPHMASSRLKNPKPEGGKPAPIAPSATAQ